MSWRMIPARASLGSPLNAVVIPLPRVPLWSQCLLLALLVGGVFSSVLGFEFLRWDDDIAVTQNALIQGELSGELISGWFQSDQAMRFKPVHWLAGWLLHQQFGLNPAAWHALNLILHVAVAVGFFLLLRQILSRWTTGGSASAITVVAWLAAAGWALHPLRVEPVAWVTASTYPMATGWLVLSFALYLRAHPPGAAPAGRGWLIGSWLTAVLAYGTYPVTVTYGLFLVIVDWGGLKCIPRWRTAEFWRWLVKIAAFLVPAVVALLATVWARYFDVGIFVAAPDLASVALSERVLMGLAGVGALAGRLIWWFDLTPNVPPMESLLSNVLGLVALAVGVVVVSVVSWRNRTQRPRSAVVWFGFIALALPCLGLTERATWPVDRYSYLGHLVLMAGLAGAGVQSCRKPRLRIGVAMAAGVVVLGLASKRQLPMWADSRAFFTALTEHPSFGEDVRQDGHVLLLWSRYEAGEGHVDRLNELREQALQTYLAGIRNALNEADYAEAVELMSHIEHHFAVTAAMQREKAAWLLELGRCAEAEHALAVSLHMKPDDERALDLLRSVRASQADTP